MRRSLHLLFRSLAAAAALGVLVIGVLAARLSAGPLSIGILAPVLERVVEGRLPVQFDVGDITLDWQSWARGPQITFADVAIEGADDGASARVRQTGLAFSTAALANGVIAVSAVQIDGGMLTLTRTVEGDWDLPPPTHSSPTPSTESPAAGTGDLAVVFDDLSGPPHGDHALGYLSQVAIRDVTVDLRDAASGNAASMRIDRADFARNEHGLAGTLAVEIAQAAADPAALTLELRPNGQGAGLAATLTLAQLRPALLAALPGAPSVLAALDLPLGGTVVLEGDGQGGLRTAELALRGGAGRLVLDRDTAARLGVAAAAQALAVRNFNLQATYRGTDTSVEVADLQLAFAPGTVVYVPEPVDHRFPLAAISGKGRLAADQLELKQAVIDLQGPVLNASGKFAGMPDAPSGTLEIVGTGIRVEQFRRYWPPKLAPGGYDWCTEHLADGVVPELRMRVDLAQRDGGLVLEGVRGRFDVERLRVDYLPPMPPIHDARGTALFDEKTLDVTVTDARAAGLRVRSGRVLLPDLDRDVPSIRIDARIEGPLHNALTVLASPPLGYPQKFGIDPGRSSGEAVVDLRLGFPLLNALRVADLDVAATADLTNVSLDAKGISVRHGNGRLEVTPEQLHLKARLAVGPAEGEVEWVESFLDQADPRSRIRFLAERVDIPGLRDELADPRLEPLLRGGSFAGTVEATLADGGRSEISGRLDVTRSSLALPPLGWNKEAGAPGSIDFEVLLDDGALRAVPKLVVLARNLDLKGTLSFAHDGGLKSLILDSLTTGRTDVAATLTRLDDGSWDALIDGHSLDLAPLLTDVRSDSGHSGMDGGGALPDFTLTADINTVWFGADAPISRAMATVVHRRQSWSPIQVQGTLRDGSTVDLAVVPEDDRSRSLTMTASNAGGALRAFDIFPDMVGGDLTARGRFDDSDPAHPLSGRLRVHDFYIVKMPLLARLLSVLALTGILDALSGRGIAFSHLDLPFEVRESVVRITNGRAYGSALGMTASGSIDRDAETISLAGELVPFYAINSALGRLPLLGDVMTGGEKGGGVFSASYSVAGPLSDPAVRVNPVTVLLPGFVRYLMETFQEWFVPGASTSADDPGPAPAQ